MLSPIPLSDLLYNATALRCDYSTLMNFEDC